jgi:hypothetical protein
VKDFCCKTWLMGNYSMVPFWWNTKLYIYKSIYTLPTPNTFQCSGVVTCGEVSIGVRGLIRSLILLDFNGIIRCCELLRSFCSWIVSWLRRVCTGSEQSMCVWSRNVCTSCSKRNYEGMSGVLVLSTWSWYLCRIYNTGFWYIMY